MGPKSRLTWVNESHKAQGWVILMTSREPAQEIDRPAGASHLAADRGETIAFLVEPASYGPDIKRDERFAIHDAMVLLAGTRAY